MDHKIISIALDLPLRRCFDYTDPSLQAVVGNRVIVPFGSRQLSGVVIEIKALDTAFSGKLRSITRIEQDMPPLPADIIALCRFVAEYYQHPLGQVIAASLPTAFRANRTFVPPRSRLCYQACNPEHLLAQLPLRAKAQHRVAQSLQTPQTPAELRLISSSAMSWVQAWLDAGWVKTSLPSLCSKHTDQIPPALNPEQFNATQAILSAQAYACFLLFGITGSGKTEVFLHAIAEVMQRGQQALVLVPEINLTPQLVERFAARFPACKIISLHSGLNDSERALGWLAASQGEADIVLGTRLAVFTPMPRLGMIIVDEEHDPSYKQQEGLRYSARDVAVYRARQKDIPIVLGSATPSLESWRNMRAGRYQLLEIKTRAVPGSVLPEIYLLSMLRAPQREGLHEQAIAAITRAMARKEQALVFLNRRGYSPALVCQECGWSACCRHCSVRLVLHLSQRRLRCHHCGYEIAITHSCPDCGNQDLKPQGRGTQRMETTLQDLFPEQRILRIDRDSTRLKGSLDEALEAIHTQEADILVGTQMLAKGHDFSHLSCVVVLEADSGLFSVDFRAEERLFALLTQVAGRAGRRASAGEVLIQTNFPEHPFYATLLARDYLRFADLALKERQQLLLPPAASWALFRAEAPQMQEAHRFLSSLRQYFPVLPGLTIHSPIDASMSKKAGLERAQLLVSAQHRSILMQALSLAMPAIESIKSRAVRWTLDVDPAQV